MANTTQYKNYFQYSISKRLWDPKSASFDWKDSMVFDDGKRFKGTCHVRATNGFGAHVVERYTVKGEYNPETDKISVTWE